MSIDIGTDLSIGKLLSYYRSGERSPENVIDAVYDGIEERCPRSVWISLAPRDEAIAAARALPNEVALPLYGIPFAVKDNMDVVGLPTTAGCPAFSRYPARSAFVIERLQMAGAILIGKTNMDQFATGLVGTRSPYGPCASVFDSRYISGGSSSGSAVAVASGLVSFSLGTDTAGSGRVPAAFNNIVGLKPTRGLLSTSGVVPACQSLDCVSVFALSCGDANLVFNAARAEDDEDPFSRVAPVPQRSFAWPGRVGVPCRDQFQFFGDAEYARLYQQAISLVGEQGAQIVEVDFTPFRQAAGLLYSGPFVAERFASVGQFVKTHLEEVEKTVAAIILKSENFTAAEAFSAEYKRRALRKQTAKYWADIDVLLLPTAPCTYMIDAVNADPITLNSNLGYYTNFVNLLDLCGVAVPAGFTSAGLPFGVTVISQAFTDEQLLGYADHIHRARASYSGKSLAALPASPLQTDRTPADWISLGVVGAHLSGQPLNFQLTGRGAKLLRATRTAADYRMFALMNTQPLKPGLIREPGFSGPGIEIEVWGMPPQAFGTFVAAVPPPLSIGSCHLEDGAIVKGFLCEPYAATGMPDITETGGWREYLRRSN